MGEAIRTREGEWRVRLYSDQAPVDFVWVWPYQRVVPPDREPDRPDVLDASGDATPAEVPAAVEQVADQPVQPQPDGAANPQGEETP